MNDPIWTLKDVTLGGSLRPRLSHVSLEIGPACTAVLGVSGAGKTSLLNLLVGFERPDSGIIERNSGPPDGRLPLFWCPPGEGLWPHLTAAQHVEAVLPGGTARTARVQILLERFRLSDKFGCYPDQLSQGECTRLALARAVASEARVLVIDEPLVHVDPAGARDFWAPLREGFAGEKTRQALVFSTHAPEVVLREAQQVICLAEGESVYSGSVEQLYYHPPSPELAWCLGPANWVGGKDWPIRLGAPDPQRSCYRPEEIAIESDPASPLVVRSAVFSGSYGEVELLDEHSGQVSRVFHRPPGQRLQAGWRVAVHLALLLWLACGLAGCTTASADPQLPVRATDSFMLPAEGIRMPAPRGLHVGRNRELFVLDTAGRVLVYDLNGKLLRQWRMPDSSVGKPEKIFQFRDGRLGVADTHYHRVVFFDDQGEVLSMHGSLGQEPGEFIYPVAIVEDDDGDYYVGEYGSNDRIQKFDRDGRFLCQIGSVGTEPGQFQRPSGIVWRDHKLYVVDAFNSRIQVFSDSGKFLEVLAAGDARAVMNYPYDIVGGSRGELYVVEYGAGRISKFDAGGRLLGHHGTVGNSAGQLLTPWGLAYDGVSQVFVADTGNRRVVAVQF